MSQRSLVTLLCAALVSGGAAAQGTTERVLTEDKVHVRTWNEFADGVYALHKKRTEGREVRTESRVGGYMRQPEFYKEVSYYDAASGELLSRIQWEKDDPDTIHVIEVFIRDDQGRLARDYTAAYLPGFRNAPNQTLVSLHNHRTGLHAFRSFDASGERIFEGCEGTLDGAGVSISLEDVDIEDAMRDPKGIMSTPAYKACFDGVPEEAGGYLVPH